MKVDDYDPRIHGEREANPPGAIIGAIIVGVVLAALTVGLLVWLFPEGERRPPQPVCRHIHGNFGPVACLRNGEP